MRWSQPVWGLAIGAASAFRAMAATARDADPGSVRSDRVAREPDRISVAAFASGRYHELTRMELIEHYVADGTERAGHTNRPPPHSTADAAWDHVERRPPAAPGRTLRVLQWNINCLYGAGHAGSGHSDWRAVRDEISRHRADVIVLNEFGDTEYEDQQGRMMTRLPCFNEQVDELARALESDGYAILGCDVEWPTVVATRLTVVEATAERLSHARGAAYVRMRLKSCDDDDDDDHGNTPRELVVFGTHFCHMSANNRKREADALLGAVDRLVGPRAATDVPVIVCGDLNQQRQRDLHPDDWTSLCKSKARRGEKPFEDGVDAALRAAGFSCCYDTVDAARNWPVGVVGPPPTHWTSTVIDYAYSRGGIECVGVYVSPSNLSDHRPVITDWLFDAD